MAKKKDKKKQAKPRPKRRVDALYEHMTPKESLQRGGKLRLGDKGGENKIGSNIDYFRFTADDKLAPGMNEAVTNAWAEMFAHLEDPTRPQRIEGVILIGQNVREVLEVKYRSYFRNRVTKVRCDGDFIERLWSEDAGDWLNPHRGAKLCAWDDPDNQEACPHGCELTGVLNFMIPALCDAAGFEFFLQMGSKSYANFMQWGGKVRTIEESPRHHFANTRCILERYEQSMAISIDGTPSSVDQWMARLDTEAPILLEALAAAAEQEMLALPGYVATDFEGDEIPVQVDAFPGDDRVIDPQAARAQLGAGPKDKPRRMGHWLSDREQYEKFGEWAHTFYLMDEGDVQEALTAYQESGGALDKLSRNQARGLMLFWYLLLDAATDQNDIPAAILKENAPSPDVDVKQLRADAQLFYEQIIGVT